MRRLTAAVSALACMGVVAGAAASVGAWPDVPGSLDTGSLDEARVAPGALSSRSVDKKTAQARYQQLAHEVTNNRRVDQGLAELRRQDCVQRFAVRQAKRMAQQEDMFHQELEPIVEECGLNVAGENVAYGYPNGRSVVNDGWMHSPGHRANILNPDYTLMGIGARKGHNGRWYVAQVFGHKA